MSNRSRALRGLAPAVLVLAAACSDRNPVGPGPVPPEETVTLTRLECRVDVARGQMECGTVSTADPNGPRAIKTIGNQNVYVKIASSGTVYDNGTQILSSNLTVQNLLAQTMGTSDGVTVTGVKVFFATGPTVNSGTGSVSVANPDGLGTFTAANQPYFDYQQTLTPYQISSSKVWQFSVDPTVGTFIFTLLVQTELVNEGPSVLRGPVWDGSVSSDWFVAGNWEGDSIPTAASSVTIPMASQIPGANMPVIPADSIVTVANLYVATGSTLGLSATNALTVTGNVDAPGTISGGTLLMSGSGALLRGNVAALVLTGSASLQGGTQATSAVSLQDGVLTVQDQALSISVP